MTAGKKMESGICLSWIVSIEHLILEGFPVPDEKKYEFQNELFSDDTFEPGELKVY